MPGVSGVTYQNNSILVAPVSQKAESVTLKAKPVTVVTTSNEVNPTIVENKPIIKTVEEPKIVEPEVEEPKEEESNIEESKVEEPINTLTEEIKPSIAKQIFVSIENLILKMYEGVFNKNPSFSPKYNETVNDLLTFIASKSAKMGVFNKFCEVFSADEKVLINANVSDSYVPYAIKLTAFIDKKTNSTTTAQTIKNLTKIFIELLGSADNGTQIISNELKAIYSFALSYGINFL